MTSPYCFFLAGLLSISAVACTDDRNADPHAGPGCVSKGCAGNGKGTSGGGTGGDGSGGGGDTGDVADIQGTVRLMADPAFRALQSSAWDGQAKLTIEPSKGKAIAEDYQGGSSFLLQDVPEGDAYLIVDNDHGLDSVLTTISFLDVPPKNSIFVPIVDEATVQGIADTFVGQPQLDDGACHVVFFLARDGKALSGVTLDPSQVPGATIAYDDNEDGAYSNDSDATGDFGKILVINATPPAGGKLAVDVLDADGEAFSIEARVEPDSISLAPWAL